MDNDIAEHLTEHVRRAIAAESPLIIRGGGSKQWLGRTCTGTPLEVAGHRGIINYHPKELVLTARCGTPLALIEETLAEQGQQLPFEPPHLDGDQPGTATIGGTIACGLSGPARPYAGAARDLVLGTRVLTGHGEVLRFGGEVMKNVAGYDVSRLMTGAYGTLGLLLDVSLKVLPIPAVERTLVQERDAANALRLMADWARRPLPITGTCFDGDRLHVRISGAETAVAQAAADIGGEPRPDGTAFWRDRIREQGHGFFGDRAPLWRLSVPPTTPPLDLPGKQLIEWGGGQRWLRADVEPVRIRATADAAGGHATLFRGGDRRGEVFHPLPPGLLALHRNLKQAFDPLGIFNRGRMYSDV
jgi:glycolate oxidase FAD binding subunit